MRNLLYILLLLPVMAMGQTTTENYVKSLIYRDSVAGSNATAQVNVTYLDGLGRPTQKIAGKMSATGKDIITPVEYDAFGRQTRNYLPYFVTTSTLVYDASGPANAINYYKRPAAQY
jgi:Domain of unknown function (DUF6443)